MSVFRKHKTENYTVMSNHHLRNKNLSLKAKGLMSVMLSLPDDWSYSVRGLCSICKENQTAINSALKELKMNGYLTVTKMNPNETESKHIEWIYDLYEVPQTDADDDGTGKAAQTSDLVTSDESTDSQIQPEQDIENHPIENRTQLNTNIINKEESNTEELITDECMLSDTAVLKTSVRNYFSKQNLQGNPDAFFEYYMQTMTVDEFVKKYRMLAIKWSDREYVDMPIVMYDDDAREQIESLLPVDLVDRIESELAESGCMQIKYSTYKRLSVYLDDDLL